MVPSSFSGVVLGSGFLWEQNRIQFPTARIVGVRGRLTAERCGAPPFCILSDPGLLLGRWAPSDRQIKYSLGVIPHYIDYTSSPVQQLYRRFGDRIAIIDVRADPVAIVEQVSKCEVILSSALHGLVVADALGIPNRWLVLGDRVLGRGFKFNDYYSAFGESREPLMIDGSESLGILRGAARLPPSAIPECIERLDIAFRQLGATVAELNR